MKSTGPAVKIFSGMVPPVHTQEGCTDCWSPDGSKIAFVHNWDIWVASAEGKSVVQFTKTPEMETRPMWSPDGTTVAFGVRQPNKSVLDAQGPSRQICVAQVSGGAAQVKVVLDMPHREVGLGPCFAWMPNKNELTIISGSGGEGIIANYPISGGDPRTMVHLKDVGLETAWGPRWSPDGRFLAFQGRTSPTGDTYFYVYQVEGAKLQRLNDVYTPFYWSPNSRWIGYYTQETVKTRPEGILWEMDVDEAVAKLAK
jgi:Tol biopolymer transport system component